VWVFWEETGDGLCYFFCIFRICWEFGKVLQPVLVHQLDFFQLWMMVDVGRQDISSVLGFHFATFNIK